MPPDCDNDGIGDGNDGDKDGDGTANDSDNEDNCEGTSGGPTPPPPGPPPSEGGSGTACTSTNITWPNDETQAGKTVAITWKLVPAGCALANGQNQSVKPTATDKKTTTVGLSKKVGLYSTSIVIPCVPNQGDTSRAVKYDFSELGLALGDTNGGYKHTITHAAPTKGCAGDTKPDPDAGPGEPTQCPSDAAGTYPNCSCPAGYTYNSDKNDCIDDDLLDFGPGDPGQCPADANRNSIYPNCSCPDGWTYNKSKNDCLPVAGNELPDEPELCTSVTFTAPEKAKFNRPYELTWRLSPKGCIPHNGNEKLMPIYFGEVQAPEIDNFEQILLDHGPHWAPLDGKATINVPDSRFCSGDYNDDTTSDGKVGVLGFVDKSRCDPFRIGAVGEDGTCDGLRIPLLSCP